MRANTWLAVRTPSVRPVSWSCAGSGVSAGMIRKPSAAASSKTPGGVVSVKRNDVEAGVVQRLRRRPGVANDSREERLPVDEKVLAVQLHGVHAAVGDWLAGPGIPDNRVGGRLEILHGAYFEIVDPDLRNALAAPDVQHELIDVGVGADYVAFKFVRTSVATARAAVSVADAASIAASGR